MIKQKILIIVYLVITANVFSQTYRTRPISSDIQSIQTHVTGNISSYPVIELNGGQSISIQFDLVSEKITNEQLRYKLIHCDANWSTNESISEIDFLDGFNDNPIYDYNISQNTTVNYTNYQLEIPNRDVSLKLSGNYAVLVYPQSYPNNILATICFSVVDPQMAIGGKVSGVTDIDTNKGHQQLSLTLNHQLNLRNPNEEIKVVVRQNNRLDNERQNIRPSFVSTSRLVYEHNSDLIFEAGNEYRRFEMASYRYNGLNVAHIEYKRPGYVIYLNEDKIRANKGYVYDQDQNGRFIFRNTESSENNSFECDYFMTHFTLAVDKPFSQNIFLNGYFTNNTFSDQYKMEYDASLKAYTLSLPLKQGMYNYQYLVQTDDGYSTAPIEGNYYETENEYNILVYYRPQGQRYDRLIGATTIFSRNK